MHRCKVHGRSGYGPCPGCIDIFGRDVVYERRVRARKLVGQRLRRKRAGVRIQRAFATMESWPADVKRAHRQSVEMKRRMGVTVDREKRESLKDEIERWEREKKEAWLRELGASGESDAR